MGRSQSQTQVGVMWKLYYHDRSTYSSEDGSWLAAPAWGVMGLAVRDETVAYTRDSNDFYVMTPWGKGQPWGADAWGVLDLLIYNGDIAPHVPISDIPPTKMIKSGIKFGRSIRTVDWVEVQGWMHDDPDFGPKSTRWPHERP